MSQNSDDAVTLVMGDNLSEREGETAEEVGEGSGNHAFAQEQQQEHGVPADPNGPASIEIVDENVTIHSGWYILQMLGGRPSLEKALLEGSVVEVRHNDETWFRFLTK